MIDTEEVAEQLGITRTYVAMLCRKGKIPAKKINENWYIDGERIKKDKLGVYRISKKKKINKKNRVKKSNKSKCVKCIWSKKCGGRTYTCLFRRCVHG